MIPRGCHQLLLADRVVVQDNVSAHGLHGQLFSSWEKVIFGFLVGILKNRDGPVVLEFLY